MIFIGIDIGKDGGIAMINGNANCFIEAIPMPVLKAGSKGKRELDLAKIYKILKDCSRLTRMIIEDATTSPIWSKTVTGELVGCRMVFEAFATALKIPYEIKKARIWQKKIFEGMNKTDTKMMALTYAKRRFPEIELTATERSTKPHSGIVDALCIAEYCRQSFK